jgi:transcriptional regulator with XRE-family HTH domain
MKITPKDIVAFEGLILRKGLSKKGFAEIIGISGAYASQIINGTRNPGPFTAKKITEALEVDFDDIFFVKHACKVGQSEEK